MSEHTPGPWIVATSNSWRRIVSQRMESVCEPIKQNDGHPDLYFRNGGSDGPDARLIAAAPELLELLKAVSASLYINDYGDWSLKTDFNADGIDQVIAKATGSAA